MSKFKQYLEAAKIDGNKFTKCQKCDGTGKIKDNDKSDDEHQVYKKCPECDGKGKFAKPKNDIKVSVREFSVTKDGKPKVGSVTISKK